MLNFIDVNKAMNEDLQQCLWTLIKKHDIILKDNTKLLELYVYYK